MKDNLLELLMNFFERNPSSINENSSKVNEAESAINLEEHESSNLKNPLIVIKEASSDSMRIFTNEEQQKLTKASYQFIVRMLVWGMLTPQEMEIILEQLLISDSPFVTLEETKWTIYQNLDNLTHFQRYLLEIETNPKNSLSLH